MNDKMTFEDVLARFGSRVELWPAEVRRSFEPMLASDAEARRLMGEAAALDAVLAQAPLTSLERQTRLSASILAAARQSGQPSASPVSGAAGKVVSLEARRRADAERARQQASKVAPLSAPVGLRGRRVSASSWPAAGVLAASLVLGVWLGSSDVTSSFTGDVVVAFAGSSETDEEVSDFPLFDLESGSEVSL